MATAAKPRWEFESGETSSGMMFSVYDECGRRLTEPYISESVARLIAAAPDLLAALEVTASMYERAAGLPMPSQAFRAIHLAKHGAASTNEEVV